MQLKNGVRDLQSLLCPTDMPVLGLPRERFTQADLKVCKTPSTVYVTVTQYVLYTEDKQLEPPLQIN